MAKQKQLVIISGMSGAGKSLASATFEDLDFICIDNLPPKLIPSTLALWQPPSEPQNVAIIVDTRAGQFFDDLLPMCRQLTEEPIPPFGKPIVLFIDASDAELVKRFKETRRKHPMVTTERGILDAIKLERQMLAGIREHADKIIDTTNFDAEDLRKQLRDIFGPDQAQERLMISIVSFGFKHGVPLDADVVFDVRFLANPYWVPRLKEKNGLTAEARQYVLSDPLIEPLLEKLFDLIEFSIPQYVKEGKAYLTIAIGCTGGKQRSVVVATELARFLMSSNYVVRIEHRDINHGVENIDAGC